MKISASTYKEERYWCQEMGFKVVEIGWGKYVQPLVPEHDIQEDSVVGGDMPVHVLLLDGSFLVISLPR
jgi:hypothetical protein